MHSHIQIYIYIYIYMCVCVCVCVCVYIYMHAYISSSSSSCRTISTDIPDPFSPPFSIIQCFRQVFWVTSFIGTEQLYVGSSWPFCLGSTMWRGTQVYITLSLSLLLQQWSRMSGSSNFDSFRDGRKWPYSCCFVGVLPPGLVQYCSQYSCVVAVKLFLHPFS